MTHSLRQCESLVPAAALNLPESCVSVSLFSRASASPVCAQLISPLLLQQVRPKDSRSLVSPLSSPSVSRLQVGVFSDAYNQAQASPSASCPHSQLAFSSPSPLHLLIVSLLISILVFSTRPILPLLLVFVYFSCNNIVFILSSILVFFLVPFLLFSFCFFFLSAIIIY